MINKNLFRKVFFGLLFLTLGGITVNAQMRIGGTVVPNPSAVLDLNPDEGDGTQRGLALPRVQLVSTTDITTIPAPKKGLLVYNVRTQNDVLKDNVYYFDDTKWVRVISGALTINDFDSNVYLPFGDSIAYYFSQTNLGDTIINYISNNMTQELVNSIFADVEGLRGITINKGTDKVKIGLPPGAAGQVLEYNGTSWMAVNRDFDHDDIVKITNEIKTYLTLGGKVYSAGNNIYFTNDTIINANAAAIGDSLLSNNSYVIQFGDSLAYHFSQTTLGDTITNYLTASPTFINNFIDTLKSYILAVNSLYTADENLIHLKVAKFTVDSTEIAGAVVDQIINNVNNLGDTLVAYIGKDSTFVQNLVENKYFTEILAHDTTFITNLANDSVFI
ncbi:MAG: hypothetical protein LBN27_04415, partial [Prevotellaceae bacterium]|nr:hypothetical protein [Prevotellaceae bacterium]